MPPRRRWPPARAAPWAIHSAAAGLATGAHERHGLADSACPDGAHDVDAGHDGAEIVRGPADERENAVRREAHQPAPTIENAILDRVPKPDPVLDALLDPRQFNRGQHSVVRPERAGGHGTPAPRSATASRAFFAYPNRAAGRGAKRPKSPT